jgi:hypothetical protein
MMIHFALSSAPSTDNPCLLILREKGYDLQITSSVEANGERLCTYTAERNGSRFAANSGPELLGLVTLWEHFGENWNRQEPDILDDIMVEEEVDSDG